MLCKVSKTFKNSSKSIDFSDFLPGLNAVNNNPYGAQLANAALQNVFANLAKQQVYKRWHQTFTIKDDRAFEK